MAHQVQMSFDYNACFKEIYYSLYSNSNASRAESIVSDVSKILLFKLLSEQDKSINIENCSGKTIIAHLAQALPERYSKSEKFHLSDNNINDVFRALTLISLSSAPSHIIGDAFQSIIGARIRGDKGQFFTPKELVECMVSIIHPRDDEFIIEKTLPTLIQTNETKESTQIDAFFKSKPKIDAFMKIDANAQRQEYKMAS